MDSQEGEVKMKVRLSHTRIWNQTVNSVLGNLRASLSYWVVVWIRLMHVCKVPSCPCTQVVYSVSTGVRAK
jgi:hypothetical protein